MVKLVRGFHKMGWKDLSGWLKGGIIGLVANLLFGIIKVILNFGSGRGVLISLSSVIFDGGSILISLVLSLFGVGSGGIFFGITIIIMIISFGIWFGIGAIIGRMVWKSKKSQMVMENE